MGQGTYTSISMILAEELDADWSRVRVEHAPADEKLYANPDLTIQATGNSNSIRAFWKPLRQAGAATRACFVEAAARSWRVSAAECRTENGKVIHDQTGRTLDYGALVGRAAAVTPPKDPPLKDPSAFRLDRPAAEAPGYSGQGQRQGQVRHRCPAAGSEVRDPRGKPSARRHGRARRRSSRPAPFPVCARSWCWMTWSRWSATTCGPPSAGSRRSTSPGMTGRTPRCPPI